MNNLMLGRRNFIKAASIVAAAVSVLPVLDAMAGALAEDSRMTDLERSVFQKLLRVSLPTAGSSLVDPSTLPVMQTLEGALLSGMPLHVRQGLRGGVSYFNGGAVKSFGTAFVNLSDADATVFCDQWTASSNQQERALAMGLKKLTVLAYWAIPDTWTPLGYGGPVTDKWRLPSLGNTPEPKA